MDKQITALDGKIVKIFDAEQVTATYTKRSFVIITDEQYPQEVQFELGQDRCSLIDSYQVDQFIKVHYNVRGRSWTNPCPQIQWHQQPTTHYHFNKQKTANK